MSGYDRNGWEQYGQGSFRLATPANRRWWSFTMSMMDFLSCDLLSTPVGEDQISERSIPILPDASDHSGGWFFRNEGVPKYVPQVLSKYDTKRLR